MNSTVKRGSQRLGGALALGLFILLTPALSYAGPGETPQGTMSAKAFTGMPKAAPIAVEFRDDTSLNNRLLPFIEDTLRGRGYTIRPGAEHVLFFETAIIPRSSDRTGIRVHGFGSGKGPGLLDARFKFPWSKETVHRKATYYRLSFSLEKGTAPPLWVGTATTALRQGNWFRVQSAMADGLLGMFEESGENRPLSLD